MMALFSTVISICLLGYSILSCKDKKAMHPNILFYALWSFVLGLSIFNSYNIIKPSNEAYVLLILMLIFYFVGSQLFLCKEKNKKNEKKYSMMNIFRLFDKINSKYFKIIIYVLIFLIIFFYVLDILVILEYLEKDIPMWQIRNWTLEPFGSSNPILDRRSFIEECLRTIVLGPFYTLLPPIAAYKFFNEDNTKEKYFIPILSLITLVLSSVAGGGGRLGFIYYFMSFFLMFFIAMKKDYKIILKKYKYVIIFGFGAMVALLVTMTITRVGVHNIFKQIYTYFALPPTLLSIWLEKLQGVEHTYGLLTSFGVYSYFVRILDVLGLDMIIPAIYNNVFTHICNVEIFMDVGYGVGNAFVSPVYYFYIDGGYPFVCIASAFFGYVVAYMQKKIENDINIRSFSVYVLISYGVFVSFMRIQVAIPSYIISFVLARLLLHPKNNKEEVIEDYKLDDVVFDESQKISIIVPIYNVEKYLGECLDSLINQTYKNIEIILINDGSIDSSLNICNDYAGKDERIIVIDKQNGGPSSARNEGLLAASGDYIVFVDSDDFVSFDYCELMIKALIKNNADCVSCTYNQVYESHIDCVLLSKSYELSGEEFINTILYNVQSGLGFCHMKMYKKSIIENLLFNKDLKVGEDALFNMQVGINTNKVFVLNKNIYNYRYTDNSIVRKYDANYVDKYLKSMTYAKQFIVSNIEHNNVIKESMHNYISYHLLLIIVNYCCNPKNGFSFIEQVKLIKKICSIDIFKESIPGAKLDGFSLTRKITLVTIKYKLFFLTTVIGEIRQLQFRKK